MRQWFMRGGSWADLAQSGHPPTYASQQSVLGGDDQQVRNSGDINSSLGNVTPPPKIAVRFAATDVQIMIPRPIADDTPASGGALVGSNTSIADASVPAMAVSADGLWAAVGTHGHSKNPMALRRTLRKLDAAMNEHSTDGVLSRIDWMSPDALHVDVSGSKLHVMVNQGSFVRKSDEPSALPMASSVQSASHDPSRFAPEAPLLAVDRMRTRGLVIVSRTAPLLSNMTTPSEACTTS